MRIHIFTLTVLLLLAGSAATAQRQHNIWYFGYHAGLDFNSGGPVALTDGKLETLEGSASIADPVTGKLLFYTDGVTVWNRDHAVMENGQGLKGGDGTSTMAAVIAPVPGDSTRYYIFTSDAGYYDPSPHDGLNYSIVDMRGDNGRGTISARNIHLADTSAEKVVVIRQCGEQAYWVVTRVIRSNTFYAFRVTQAGVSNTPVISSEGLIPISHPSSAPGYMKASVDGRRLAVGFQLHDTVDLYDFNPITGKVSNPIHLWAHSYGLAFSPDNTKLYAWSYSRTPSRIPGLYQYDISRSKQNQIEASRYVVTNYYPDGAMQIGPDGKIYCARFNDSMLSVIENPNESGFACGFKYRAIDLKGGLCKYGLPNLIDSELFPDNMFAGPDTTICEGESVTINAYGGVRYEWSPATGLSCVNCASPVASPTSTTNYSVHIFGNACDTIDTVVVTVLPLPVIKISQPPLLCPGDTIQLEASGGDSYVWTPAHGLSCTDCAAPLASPIQTTTYTVTGTGANGCSNVARVTVSRSTPIVVNAGADVTICDGESAQLQVKTAGSAYHWSPATGLSCTDCPNPVASPATTTLYTVTVESLNRCPGNDTVRVNVLKPDAVDAGDDEEICAGDSVQLQAKGDGILVWSPADGLSCTDCRTPFAAPATTTTYRLTVRSDAGCRVVDSVTIHLLSLPDVDAGQAETICRGGSAQLEASIGATYDWSPADGLSCTDCRSPVASPAITTLYHLTVTGKNGCRATDTVTVTVGDADAIDAGEGGTICVGNSLQLRASDGIAWRWSPADGLSCSDCQSPLASPGKTTTYSVSVTTDKGCTGTDTVIVSVSLSVDAGTDLIVCPGEAVQLSASPADTYQWRADGSLSCTDCQNPIARPDKTTTYYVTVTGVNDCGSTDSVVVVVSGRDSVQAHIGRNHSAAPGAILDVPVVLDVPISSASIDTLIFTLGFNTDIVRLDAVDQVKTLLDDWAMTVLHEERGELDVQFVAPPGSSLSGSGELLRLRLHPFLGSQPSSELPFTIQVNNSCVHVETVAGSIQLDSICGLSYRLIELVAAKYSLSQNDPNPFNPTTRIAFSLAFDGPARLEVFDAAGTRVAVLVEDAMAAGSYEAVWDARNAASGVYYYRLTSGTWSATRRMVVVK